jgi:hypothetical protein
MYTVTLNELKAVSAQKTSSEPMAQDEGFREVKRRKRQNFNGKSQSTKEVTKTVAASAAVKMPPKATSTQNYSEPLTTTDMDTEYTGAENMLPKQEAPKKSGRPPPIVVNSTTNLIRLQSDLKDHVKEE